MDTDGKITDSIEIRRALSRELEFIRSIERVTMVNPWSHKQWDDELRRRDTVLYVAVWNNLVVGYMAMILRPSSAVILRMAVAPELQRNGIGSLLISLAKEKLRPKRREVLQALVGGRDIGTQLFFKSQGFVADKVLPADESVVYDGSEELYRFHYRYNASAE